MEQAKEKDLIEQIVDYLNKTTQSRYRPQNAETRKIISGRLKEGATFEDFQAVIDYKADEWMCTDMEQYLRPSTLFRPSHFENYLSMALKAQRPAQQSSVPSGSSGLPFRRQEQIVR